MADQIVHAAQHRLAFILKHLPSVQHALAYGSGVLHQPGLYSEAGAQSADQPSTSISGQAGRHGKNKPVVDFLLAVKDPLSWHEKNIERNPTHYSWVSQLGAKAVCGIADNFGVGVHFNTLVNVEDQVVKYGVLSQADLVDDLTTWRHVYAAGRMHKPVATLAQDPQVAEAQALNVRSAATTALLLLPPSFTSEDLLHKVVGLSYHGDIRMGIAEDKHKVPRIVEGSREALRSMYLPLVSAGGALDGVAGVGPAPSYGEDYWQQDMSPDARLDLLRLLPRCLLHEMAQRSGYQVPESHLEIESTRDDILWAAVQSGKHQKLLDQSLEAIVRRSSTYQAVAGVFAAGGGKAVEYVARKVQKLVTSSAVKK